MHHKKRFELYTKIHGLIAVNSCQIERARKDQIMVTDELVIL